MAKESCIFIWLSVIFAAAIITVTFIGSTMAELTANNVNPGIRITSPANGEIVSNPVAVKGTISGEIPTDRNMWVVVNPRTLKEQYWPQSESHIIPIKGEWSLNVNIGGDKGQGAKFDIVVVLVDKIADQDFITWVNNGKATSNYPSIKLPENATIVDKITVIKM